MLEGGFILLHRSILRWEWYGDLNTARLFIHLLLTVNYEPQRWQGIAVERGQRVASMAKLADETGLTVKQVRTALEHLKRTGEVTHTCALPGFVDSKNEEKTERNAGYLVVSQSGGGMLRQDTREGIRRTPANRGMRAHRIVKGLDISEDVCHGMCP